MEIELRVNGSKHALQVEPHETLLEVLRDRLGLTGTKLGCGVQMCGACTVLVDGRAVSACTYLAYEARGRDVLTIEGLAEGSRLHPLQEAFMRHGAFQCGYCTPGMILAAKALLDENPHPAPEEVRAFMRGNICRCTGYKRIVEAILDAAARMGGTRSDGGWDVREGEAGTKGRG